MGGENRDIEIADSPRLGKRVTPATTSDAKPLLLMAPIVDVPNPTAVSASTVNMPVGASEPEFAGDWTLTWFNDVYVKQCRRGIGSTLLFV